MIGENLQYLRKFRGLTQEALAERISVSRQTIAKWESGESVPDVDMAAALSRELDVSLDELVSDSMGGLPPGVEKGKYMFGLVTVGDKGQIVIPVRARRIFHIQPGDQLMVLGDEDRGLALVDPRFILQAAEVIKHAAKK